MMQFYLLWLRAYLPCWHLFVETHSSGWPHNAPEVDIPLCLSIFDVSAPEDTVFIMFFLNDCHHFSNQVTLLCVYSDIRYITPEVLLSFFLYLVLNLCASVVVCSPLPTWPFYTFAWQSVQPVSNFLCTWVFYLQGCVFCVFVLLCLIDSSMGFLNKLSSDLFPQELMTQKDFKDAPWKFKSLWSETTAFVLHFRL